MDYKTRNKNINLQRALFTYQLTDYMPMHELKPFEQQILKYEKNSYGRYYIVKQHRTRKDEGAIFTKGTHINDKKEPTLDEREEKEVKDDYLRRVLSKKRYLMHSLRSRKRVRL